MKFLTIASGVALAITGAAAQLTAPMQNYNVSSPVSNGPYVEGQVLPCTVQLFDNIPSGKDYKVDGYHTYTDFLIII